MSLFFNLGRVFLGALLLIYANLANLRFLRKLATGESIDINLAAVFARRRPG
jgi:hypothetical protein